MRNYTILLIVTALIVTSLGFFFYKTEELKFPILPSEESESWVVEARLGFQADRSFKSDIAQPSDQPVRLQMHLPRQQDGLATVEEQFVAEGYGMDEENLPDRDRIGIFTKRKGGRDEVVFYRGIFYKVDSSDEDRPEPKSVPKAQSPFKKSQRPNFVGPEVADPVLTAIDAVIAEAGEEAADKQSLIKALARSVTKDDDRTRLIYARVPEIKTPAALLVLLLNTADIPARLAHGLPLDAEQKDVRFTDWAEVWYGNSWKPIDPLTQKFHLSVPHMTWWVGDDTPYELEGGRNTTLSLSVKKNTDDALVRAIWQSGESAEFLQKFSLFNLPIGTQILFQIMLMIPVGGFIIAVIRQVIGIRTFGTFMPVLIALAFRETGLAAGVFTFCLIVVLGLVIRSWFHRLQLLMVPRLAAVLTIVVLLICFLAMLAQNLGLTLGLSLSLFPIVILTMTIERMALTWDEYGPREATTIGLGSLISAIVAFFVLTNEFLTHLVFTFPELLLIVLALNILLGRYNGYKLSEYKRFKALERQITQRNHPTHTTTPGKDA